MRGRIVLRFCGSTSILIIKSIFTVRDWRREPMGKFRIDQNERIIKFDSEPCSKILRS